MIKLRYTKNHIEYSFFSFFFFSGMFLRKKKLMKFFLSYLCCCKGVPVLSRDTVGLPVRFVPVRSYQGWIKHVLSIHPCSAGSVCTGIYLLVPVRFVLAADLLVPVLYDSMLITCCTMHDIYYIIAQSCIYIATIMHSAYIIHSATSCIVQHHA